MDYFVVTNIDAEIERQRSIEYCGPYSKEPIYPKKKDRKDRKDNKNDKKIEVEIEVEIDNNNNENEDEEDYMPF